MRASLDRCGNQYCLLQSAAAFHHRFHQRSALLISFFVPFSWFFPHPLRFVVWSSFDVDFILKFYFNIKIAAALSHTHNDLDARSHACTVFHTPVCSSPSQACRSHGLLLRHSWSPLEQQSESFLALCKGHVIWQPIRAAAGHFSQQNVHGHQFKHSRNN